MAVNFSVSDTDRIMRNIRRELKNKMPKGKVNVGVSDQKSTEAAFVAEFGAPHVVPRPFITAAVYKNVANYRKIVVDNYPVIMSGKMNVNALMEMIGISAVNDIRQYMMEMQTPTNSEVTVQIKGYNNPLITDDLELYDSITYKVLND